MHYTISHTRIGNSPFWCHLECAKNLEKAKRRAQGYVLDHGGYAWPSCFLAQKSQ